MSEIDDLETLVRFAETALAATRARIERLESELDIQRRALTFDLIRLDVWQKALNDAIEADDG